MLSLFDQFLVVGGVLLASLVGVYVGYNIRRISEENKK
ncbi:hypothetical protein LCGC14_2915420 [marine sediment metagenome]|uniref:Uncharacterized protein n=1 Tax=marine sediment metagenome TaxID=412755 RepID=A0A0F8XQF5_9ZZZZ